MTIVHRLKEDIMPRFKQGVIAILLTASIVMAATDAYASVPRVCSLVGCSGGPDTCLTVSVRVGSMEVSMACFARYATN
jgi:hypothetical protein